MKLHYLPRWAVLQGSLRLAMTVLAIRGDAASRLYGFPMGHNDPYRVITDLRSHGRITKGPLAWTTADYQLSRAILRDKRFEPVPAEDLDLPFALRKLTNLVKLPPNPAMSPAMLVTGDPHHLRMRRPLASAFTPRAIEGLRHRIEDVTARLLAELPEGTTVDLIPSFAAQLPVTIITEILGLPPDAREYFLTWSAAITPLFDVGITWSAYRRLVDSLAAMDECLQTHLARLRVAPGEDLLSALITRSDFDEDELRATACLLLVAGFETTVNLIGNAIRLLLDNPDQLTALRADPDLWPNAVEEALRFDAPVQMTPRIALSDVTVDGVQVPKGTIVMVSLAGAGRDPQVFADPDRFDVTRANARDHIAFSGGVHMCLGAFLARNEATHALRALFDTFPDIQVDGTPRRCRNFTLHGFSHLPVHLGRRASTSVDRQN